ncbi:hypothetical protein N0V93_006681 [Gnomoniopsis smithogilvyi]|uniref:Uncharacterized protein n=1 Tax=Gnomoniopsis smithogilvyi TaxID=1191159 RepID=A0A9W8YS53_9PEZI|nr:hypothetical protein N0V93_006681 [Gnomoniopsis smithogilvyi]
MGGKVWSAEEEEYLWEAIVPQAPAGLDSASKQAKKEARTAWAPLSSQMEQEMTKRLKPEEHLRRKYTPSGCYEHYFQNYINRHYSPHAKALVLKYRGSLKTTASIAGSQSTTNNEASSQMIPEPIADPSSANGRYLAGSPASHHHNGMAIPMPEAPMPLVQAEGVSSAMQVLCDSALDLEKADLLDGEEDDREDESMDRSSCPKRERPAHVVTKYANDAVGASIQRGRGSRPQARRDLHKTQRDQRRIRKAAHRHAQASEESTPTDAVIPNSPLGRGSPNVHAAYYRSPMMYGHHPAPFGYHYGMQNGGPLGQNANAFHSSYAVGPHGFHHYGGRSQLGGVPTSNNLPYFGFGGPPPHHAFPYMGGHYNSEHVHHDRQGFGNSSAYTHGEMGSQEGMNGHIDEMSSSSDLVEKVLRSGNTG